ncbi:MAG: trypsin-like peptidase domain-containing protein [Anaerolineae bacterium]|nr:trypsin-like peptidase domain-containing protein [Anaerolineae bacterium]
MERLAKIFFFVTLVMGMVAAGIFALNVVDTIRETGAEIYTPKASRTRIDTLAKQAATPTLVPISMVEDIVTGDETRINIYQRVNPAVVNIEITQRTTFYDGIDASGSGFVYDVEGHIITNAHVVRDAVEILVTFHDGYVTNAEIVGIDEYSDIGVIRVDVDPARLIPVTLGDSSQLLVGQSVVAIGNPFGLQGSLTQGIISALGRALPSAQLISQANQSFNNPSIIQVDAAINPGNSGGPLLNYRGEVVGVNTAIRTESGTFEGVAFAVPSNTIKRIVPQLIENGEARYSWLGISTVPDEPGFSVAALAEVLGLPVDHGVLVEDVTPGSPAAVAGIRGGTRTQTVRGVDIFVDGDIIVAINGIFVRDLDQLLGYLVENTSPGDVVTMTLVRGAETLDVQVELGVRP